MNENKNEGKVKILQMLAEGKITVEQSLELLAQFKDEEEKSRRPHVMYMDPRQVNPNKRRKKNSDCDCDDDDDCDCKWDEDCEYDDEDGWEWDEDNNFGNNMANLGQHIKSSIENSIGVDLAGISSGISQTFKEIGKDLEDVDIDINLDLTGLFGTYKHKSTITYISDPIAQNISQLKLVGKNAKVEIRGYDGDRLRITCKYNPKRKDARILVNENNGSYEVLYDYNAMRSLAIYAEVPRHILVESIHGESKNAHVDLLDVKCGQAHLLTKNSSVRIENTECNEIVARTRNASIKAERLRAGHIDFETNNDKIALERAVANSARLTTSNSKVVTEHCNIRQLFIKTSNAGIKMEHLFGNDTAQDGWDGEHIIEAHTTNGNATIYIPRHVAAMVQASTSNGRVDSDLPGMVMDEISKNYLSGKHKDYDDADKKVRINVSTTNSTIKFRGA